MNTDVKVYLVGGAVRDMIMGKGPKDLDFVVVGSTPEKMVELGFTQVGADFPVFLHPETKEEFALARTERKSGTGHKGFDCEWEGVTLVEDLSRRDLTMNAMAMQIEYRLYPVILQKGCIMDPFYGQEDIASGTIRHVSAAFAEDPLRALRAIRFEAQTGFKIHPETADLLMKLRPQLKELTPERVWGEMEKALSSKKPSEFFKGMWALGMLPEWETMFFSPQPLVHHPEGDTATHTAMVMDNAAIAGDPKVVFAALCHDFGKPVVYREHGKLHGHEEAGVPVIEEFCAKWRVPNEYRDLAIMTAKYHTKIHGAFGRNGQGWMRPKNIMAMFKETNALAKRDRFRQMLRACASDARGRGKTEVEKEYYRALPYTQEQYMLECLAAAALVDSKAVSAEAIAKGLKGEAIGNEVRIARITTIRSVQIAWKSK